MIYSRHSYMIYKQHAHAVLTIDIKDAVIRFLFEELECTGF